MSSSQLGILADGPNFSRYLEFGAIADTDPVPVLRGLALKISARVWLSGSGSGWCKALALPSTASGRFRPWPGPGPKCHRPRPTSGSGSGAPTRAT